MPDGFRVINGTHGALWEDGNAMAEVSAFQVKVAKNKSSLNFCGQMAEDSKVTGIKITGSMTLHKIYTRGSDDVEQVQAGHDLRKTLVGALKDPRCLWRGADRRVRRELRRGDGDGLGRRQGRQHHDSLYRHAGGISGQD